MPSLNNSPTRHRLSQSFNFIRPLGHVAKQSHDLLFSAIHSNSLIYNACWEDPRIDRKLLQLQNDSKVVMLTSAGCNALDYLLDAPAEIHTVDVNSRQNALLQLKLAVIRETSHDDLFHMFGFGVHHQIDTLYRQIRTSLPDFASSFWDKHTKYFEGNGGRGSFYYRGGSGFAAWLFSRYMLKLKKPLRNVFYELLECRTLRDQRSVFAQIEPAIWDQMTRWLVQQPVLMSLLGVPRPQIQLMEETDGSIQRYIDRCLRHVLTEIPISDNYFWRVYLTGSYSSECCPNYVKSTCFDTLQQLVARVFTHTVTLSDFLLLHPGQYSHFVLLDHQDWLAWKAPEALAREWRLILQNARPGAKILLRSASSTLDFIPAEIKAHLRFYSEQTDPLHKLDRVGTYASVHLAEVI